MATNLNSISPDALLKIVEQVKEYDVEPPPKRQRGRPRTFSGLAFLLLAVVGVVLRTFKAVELHTLLTKDATLRRALVLAASRIDGPLSGGWTPRCPKPKPKSKPWATSSWP